MGLAVSSETAKMVPEIRSRRAFWGRRTAFSSSTEGSWGYSSAAVAMSWKEATPPLMVTR